MRWGIRLPTETFFMGKEKAPDASCVGASLALGVKVRN